MAVQHETELYLPLKQHFEAQGYTVKSEVRHCDLVGFLPGQDQPLIVEMKRIFNLALLLQGLERQKLSPLVYLAVERNRTKKGAHSQKWSEIIKLCQRLDLGLITVTHYKTKAAFVEVLCTPSVGTASSNRVKPIKNRVSKLVTEFHERSGDYNVGGSRGTKLVTAYRERALKLATVMSQSTEPMAPRQVRDLSGIGKAAAMLRDNYYGWFNRVSRGLYALTPEGQAALQRYDQVTASHRLFAEMAEVIGDSEDESHADESSW
ncbi:hypothetical protein J2Z69_003262 [Paenibacillus shirakamiensis]|uniref:Uncharacterized protein n=1 Tax=Paenibacillus shirakamiensis TaxID=1265935 RepID=A0ABS4JKH3_9BACL|nr:DUF2161 family putative PD-(D/E)XK-type phosphodiesterase [Paenibacillus shirakamiensis]MBP2002205.1 hypothetical protein [Paenibacillus shirakamiensis]